jgi:hypothetical protein
MTEQIEAKPVCFVIQAFDGGKFDRRYIETIRPALVKAGVDPQRADEILGLNPIIEKIEKAIESAAICVAEVSEDNPNVWLELGYALALNRPTVILCDRAIRSKLPFDVQHRPVIFYRTDSKSGYDELEREIVKYVATQLASETIVRKATVLKIGQENASDLEQFEVIILTIAFTMWPTLAGTVSHWELEKALKARGFNPIALALGVTGLLKRSFLLERLVEVEENQFERNEEKHYQISPDGIAWIDGHRDILELRLADQKPRKPANFDDMDDDIPF